MSGLYPRGVDSEPLHPSVKIRAVRLQSSRGIGDVSSGLGERSRNHGSLEAVQFFRQRCRSARDRFARITDSLLRSRRRRHNQVLGLVPIHDEHVFDLLPGDLSARMQDRQSLDDIGELPNVAGPGVVAKQLECVAPPARFCLSGSLQELLGKMLDQLEDIVAALAQRRDRQRNHLEPEVQVLSKRSSSHRALKVVIRRREDSHVGANNFVAPDSLNLLGFDRAQQLGLRIGTKITNFVQKQSAVMCELEPADTSLCRPGRDAGSHRELRSRRAPCRSPILP